MRVLDRTFLTEDEQFNPQSVIAEAVESCLRAVKMDTYNARYVIRITVDEVDDVEGGHNG